MSVLLDEDTIVLEDLDFPQTCDCMRNGVPCGAEASHALKCSGCGEVVGFSCFDHVIYIRKSERYAIHKTCGTELPMRELLEVVPL